MILYGTLIPGYDHITWQMESEPARVAHLTETYQLELGVVKRVQYSDGVNHYYVLVEWGEGVGV